jgi:hypothetical protein
VTLGFCFFNEARRRVGGQVGTTFPSDFPSDQRRRGAERAAATAKICPSCVENLATFIMRGGEARPPLPMFSGVITRAPVMRGWHRRCSLAAGGDHDPGIPTDFIRSAPTVGGALAAGPASGLTTDQNTPTGPSEHAGGPRNEAWYPLRRPDEVPASLSVLTCAPAMVNMGDGVLRGVLAYNGRFPGPTWEARPGDRVAVQLQNGLGEPTITHWHGLVVDFPNDGGPLP